MKKSHLFLLVSFFLVPLVSANFACGTIQSSIINLPPWANVFVYYDENPSITTSCIANPEHKFCCDLEEIHLNWSVQKLVHAIVMDSNQNLIGGPTSLLTSEEGYDVFPEMFLETAISIAPFQRVNVNKSSVTLNISINPKLSSIKYSLTNQNNSINETICTNCTNAIFDINLFKGKNEIKIIASNDKEISQTIEAYSLDYLNISREMICEKCKNTPKGYIVPVDTNVTVKLTFNSSHEISGELADLISSDWTIYSSLVEDYSETHKRIRFDISDSYTEKEYIVKTPNVFFPRVYEFSSEFEDYEFPENIRLTRFSGWPSILYWKEGLKRLINLQEKRKYFMVSEKFPLILITDDKILDLVAVYPNKYVAKVNGEIKSSRNLFWKRNQITYQINTNLRQIDIENVVFQYKLPKDKKAIITQNGVTYKSVKINFDEEYNYYRTDLKTKDEITLKIIPLD